MTEAREASPVTRIVLELSTEGGTLSGTLATADERRSFWGWLELMSALELATGAGAVNSSPPARSGGSDRRAGPGPVEAETSQITDR